MPRILDLFCGAGGASMGYAKAGWDVVGVDLKRQRSYPFEFRQADAIEFLTCGGWLGFDAIHASPPCQLFSAGTRAHGAKRDRHADLVTPIREGLLAIGLPYVIENVVGAPLIDPLVMCGSQFDRTAHDPRSGLTCFLRRHRLFESNVYLMGAGPDRCHEFSKREGWVCAGVYGGASHNLERARKIRRGGYVPSPDVGRALMGIDWMGWKPLTQSIPPDYTEWIGRQLLEAVR